MATLSEASTFLRVCLSDADGTLWKGSEETTLLAEANSAVYEAIAETNPYSLTATESNFTWAANTRSADITGVSYLNDSAFYKLLYLGYKSQSGVPSASNPVTPMTWQPFDLVDERSVGGTGPQPPFGDFPVGTQTDKYCLHGNTLYVYPVGVARYFHAVYLKECATVSSSAHELLSPATGTASPLAKHCLRAIVFKACVWGAPRAGQDAEKWEAMYERELSRLQRVSAQRAHHLVRMQVDAR